MLVSQVMIAFRAIKKFPGEDLDGLAERIHGLYGDMDASRWLIHGELKYTLLPSRIREMACIVERDGRYYFDLNIKPYSRDPILNSFIVNDLEEEKKPQSPE